MEVLFARDGRILSKESITHDSRRATDSFLTERCVWKSGLRDGSASGCSWRANIASAERCGSVMKVVGNRQRGRRDMGKGSWKV